jgi:hypothetical protein
MKNPLIRSCINLVYALHARSNLRATQLDVAESVCVWTGLAEIQAYGQPQFLALFNALDEVTETLETMLLDLQLACERAPLPENDLRRRFYLLPKIALNLQVMSRLESAQSKDQKDGGSLQTWDFKAWAIDRAKLSEGVSALPVYVPKFPVLFQRVKKDFVAPRLDRWMMEVLGPRFLNRENLKDLRLWCAILGARILLGLEEKERASVLAGGLIHNFTIRAAAWEVKESQRKAAKAEKEKKDREAEMLARNAQFDSIKAERINKIEQKLREKEQDNTRPGNHSVA